MASHNPPALPGYFWKLVKCNHKAIRDDRSLLKRKDGLTETGRYFRDPPQYHLVCSRCRDTFSDNAFEIDFQRVEEIRLIEKD